MIAGFLYRRIKIERALKGEEDANKEMKKASNFIKSLGLGGD